MLCSKCGNPLNDNDKFCGKCGLEIDRCANIHSVFPDGKDYREFEFKRKVLFGNNSYSRNNKMDYVTLYQDKILKKKLLLFKKYISYSNIKAIEVKNTVDTGNIIGLAFVWSVCIFMLSNEGVSGLSIGTLIVVLLFTIKGIFFFKVLKVFIIDDSGKKHNIVTTSTKETPIELINSILLLCTQYNRNVSVIGNIQIQDFDKQDKVVSTVADTVQDFFDE